MSMPSARAACPGPPCVQLPAAASVQHTQPWTVAPSPRTSRTRWQKGAMRTVLGATLVTTIPVLMRLWLGSHGYALPQTPKKPSFQPGSGALAPVTMVQLPQSQSPDDQQRKLTERGLPERDTIAVALAAVLAAVGASAVCMMMPAGGGGGHRETTHRVPPTWSPENDQTYSFRAYMTDISLWIMLTDLQPHQQCAAIVTRLGGSAREVARMISPQEIMMGGVRNGIQLDPVSYLMAALQDRFAALDEETRLASMTEMLAFARRPGESINALLSRYEIVRMRAATEGQFVMSVEGCALQLLRACNIHPQQLQLTLQPFGGLMPATEAQLSLLVQQLRRQGHLTEGVHGNIGTILHGPMRQARPGAYLAGDADGQQQEGDSLNAADAQHAYWGQNAGRRSSPASWNVAPNPSTDWAASAGGHPDAGYPGWASGTTAPHGSQAAYQAEAEEFNIGTDDEDEDSSETSSDSGNEEIPDIPGLEHLSQADAAEHIYLQFRRAKRTWRRFTGRPVRKFRRFFKKHKRFKGKGKGKGKGRSHGGFMWTQDDTLAYLKGKGKGKRSHTSGKGFGRRGNPRDRNGEVMKCHNCGSEEHLAARCPQKGSGKGSRGKGKDRGIDFTGLAVLGEGGHADPQESTGRVFGLPPPWSPAYNSYMNYDDGGQEQWMPDPWQNSTADRMRRQARVTPNMEAMADAWANYQRTSDFPAAGGSMGPPYGRGQYGADDELSQASSGHRPPPLGGPDLRMPPASSATFSRDAIASLIRGYRPEAAPVQEMPPWRPASAPVHTSLFAPAEVTQELRRADLDRVTQVQQAASRWRRQREGEIFIPAFMRQMLPLQSLSERAAAPAQRLVQPAQPAGPSGLTRGIPPIENSVSADRVTDGLTNIQNAIAVANSFRAGGGHPERPGQQQMRFPAGPAFADLAFDATAALQQGTSAASVATLLGAQVTHFERMANEARRVLDEFIATQPEHAREVLRRELRTHGLLATVGISFPNMVQIPAPAAHSPPSPREDPPPVFYDEAGQCSICHNDFEDGERVCRLRCRHMFHSECWEPVMRLAGTPNPAAGGDSRFRDDCPNCRGQGAIIAVWDYVDPELITQRNEFDDRQIAMAAHPGIVLEQPPSHFGITPPSTGPSTPRGRSASPAGSHRGPSSFPVVDTDVVLPTYHALTRLADGRPALLVDPGSVGNLCGETWARSVADAAKKVGKMPTYTKRSRVLNVQGVGKGSQSCEHDLALPISMRTVDGVKVMSGKFVTPAIPGSDVPGLLGLTALTTNRAILDCNTRQLHFCGPGDYDLTTLLPPGTDSLQLEVAPSGHLVLPCCEYDGTSTSSTPAVSLLAKQVSDTKGKGGKTKPLPLRDVPPPPAHSPRGVPEPPPGLDA